MAIKQTYESHLVGIGSPMTGDKWTGVGLFNDSVRWLPFAQALSYDISQNRKKVAGIGGSTLDINAQQNWPDVGVSVRQLDYLINDSGYNHIYEDINLYRKGSATTGSYVPLLKQLITGGRNNDGAAIYFVTDTGQIGRDQIDVPTGNTGYYRQLTVIDPCYLTSVSWSTSVRSLGVFEFNFVGQYVSVSSQQKGNVNWDWNIHRVLQSGKVHTGRMEFDSIQETGTYIKPDSASGLFVGGNTLVTGAPDFGEIKAIRWSIDIPRREIEGLGNQMIYDRKIILPAEGKISIEYNYEGQEFDGAQNHNSQYNIGIDSANYVGNTRSFLFNNCLLDDIQLNSDTNGEPDSYSVSFSFEADSLIGAKELYTV